MEKIKNYFRNYLKKSSWFKISTDFLFYLFIIFLLVPSTRTMLIRATLIKPKVVKEETAVIIKPGEFQLILEDLQGNTINLSDFSNRVIFVNFWATWCPPCRAEMPALQKFYNRYENKMQIFLITSEERSKVESYLNEYGYVLPVYFQRSSSTGILDVNSLPSSYLISEKGEILVQKKGAADWNSKEFRKKVDEILSKNQD